MKKSVLFLAMVLVFAPLAARGTLVQAAQAADTVQSVIEKHIAAMGGRDALMKITSRKGTGMIGLSTPIGELSGPVELYSKAPNKSRAVMSLDLAALGSSGTLVVEQLFDGQSAWSINPMQGDQPIVGVQLENMRNNFFPSPFLMKDSPDKLELLPRENVSGKSWIVMKVTRPSGNALTLYFDPATYLLARTLSTTENPQTGGMMQQSSESQDYRTVDGIKVPFTIINSSELQTVTIKLTKVEHNIAIDDAMFKKK